MSSYLSASSGDTVTVRLTVTAGNFSLDGERIAEGDQVIYTGTRDVIRRWERAGTVTVTDPPKKRGRKKKDTD